MDTAHIPPGREEEVIERSYDSTRSRIISSLSLPASILAMCQENKMIKGSTVLKLYDKIEEVQREYEHFDNKQTLMEYYYI